MAASTEGLLQQGYYQDEELVLQALRPVVPAIAQLFGSHCEVVLHDLRNAEQSIIEIANGHLTGRRPGGPIIGGPMEDLAVPWLYEEGPPYQRQVYETRARDGRRLKSLSIVYRNAQRQPFAALCINYDLSSVTEAWRILGQLLSLDTHAPTDETPENGEVPDIDQILTRVIEDCLPNLPRALDKAERLDVIRKLNDGGVFLIRGAVQRVADALGVSKFTVYRYLEEIRKD